MENPNQRQLLTQLEVLAQKAAEQQSKIAGEEAEFAFRTLLKHKIEIKMKKQAEETYKKLLVQTQELVNQFAKKASQRALDLESRTINQASIFEGSNPEFASFTQTLESERNHRTTMAKLIEGSTAAEADILAAHSIGMPPEEIASEILGDENSEAIAKVKQVISAHNKQ
ncbi:MAG: hypothetical protein AB4426_06950 [Xenococcaceae cyanobacterium]